MKYHKNLLAVQTSLNRYRSRLEKLNEDLFAQTPPSGGWSFSEVYCHIFDANLLSLMAIRNCIKGEGKDRPTAFAVRLILFFGQFPPGKYKVPGRLAGRVRKISLSEARQWMEHFDRQLNTLKTAIPEASDQQKIAHPRLGYLNARQWLRFIDIHSRHHLKQLQRIQRDHEAAN